MSIYKDLASKSTKLAVVGLGYVGLPLAVAFAKHFLVIGFDENENKVQKYLSGTDVTGEIGDEALKTSHVEFTTDRRHLSEARFIIIAVPTPIHGDKTPDLTAVKEATRTVAGQLQYNSTVVYESTVYPGVTEEICIPILEEGSGGQAGEDFKVGYSPERINPGDTKHRLHNIVKIVSGMDSETCEAIKAVYDTIVERTFPVSSIKVAEAAKLVENAQRDINIAFMNELARAFHLMGINTEEVAKAMDTKWNALGFRPGLVGGHCIGVDPYYFIYQAENLGYHSQIIAAGRRVNNDISKFVAQETIKMMIRAKVNLTEAKIVLFGMTFKENCADIRNSRAVDVYRYLLEYDLKLFAVDPWANKEDFQREYDIMLTEWSALPKINCAVFLVAHQNFCMLNTNQLQEKYSSDFNKVIIDVKSIYDDKDLEEAGFYYWSL